ncbi:IS3 family transposase [Gimesia maris]|uniref:IS3 family transposase n=1 Tax=Gimesia maris TaxID=122 RepID=UPI0036F3A08D
MNKRRKRHNPEQIVRKLRDADAMLNAGKDLASVLQTLEVSESTYLRWRNQYGGMKSEEAKRLKQLEDENKRLKELVADLSLDNKMLKYISEGNWLSPSRKRAAVNAIQDEFHVSERRACVALDQPRSTQRYQSSPRSDEPSLVKRMYELVRSRPRFGYRRIARLLQREGWQASFTRVYRLWRREGLKVPQKKRKRRRLGDSRNGCHRLRPEQKDHVWCWDFVFDRTASGSSLKWFSIVDEFTRECLSLKVDRSIRSEDVIDTLAELFSSRGVPQCIRSDNGPEFISKAIQRWLSQLEINSLYIEPGAPWENGYAESFNSRFRDEFLAVEEFESLLTARRLTVAWWEDYNGQRPHSSLGYVTPAEFASRCAVSNRAAPSFQLHSEIT